MKPVIQTRLGGNPEAPGNCFAAAIASILEVPLAEVPDEKTDVIDRQKRKPNETDDQFYSRCWSDYWLALSQWLKLKYGLAMLEMEAGAFSGAGFVYDDDCFMIASGKSPRGLEHAVVCQGMEIVHDPHPEGGGLVNPANEWNWVFFLPLDPSECTRS